MAADSSQWPGLPPGKHSAAPLERHFGPDGSERCQPEQDFGAASELEEKLAKRRSQLETTSRTFESQPAQSKADAAAPHLSRLAFGDAPPLGQWLRQLQTPEEDRVAELLGEAVRLRGQLPEHAPGSASRLEHLAQEVRKLHEELEKERAQLGGARETLEQKEAGLAAAEVELEAERWGVRPEKPGWLQDAEGTINVGVVGNSGVGKSLLINRLRGLQPGAEGWAAVGVCETTLEVSMYAFPNQRHVRLLDFPGAGTPEFPLDSYVERMGLRYLDFVLIANSSRFTETEAKLQAQLRRWRIPHCLVRTKVDIDVFNNKEDNSRDEQETIASIRREAWECCGEDPFLVSLRDPEAYDLQSLLENIWPCLESLKTGNADWDSAWALPEEQSGAIQALQGRWTDGATSYVVHGTSVHVTLADGQCAVTQLEDRSGSAFWQSCWSVTQQAAQAARADGALEWQPSGFADRPVVWKWAD